MPAPTNISAATARAVGWGTVVEDVSGGSGPDYPVWMKYTAQAREIMLSVRAHAPLGSAYQPYISNIYVGPADSLSPHPYVTSGGDANLPQELPVVPGTTYFFEVIQNNTGVAPDVDLQFTLLSGSSGLALPGDLIITDDTPGFPAAIFRPSTGQIMGYIDLPSGESGEQLPDGTTLVHDNGLGGVRLYDRHYALAATPGVSQNDSGTIGSNRVDTFYVGHPGTGATAATITVVSSAGAVLATDTLTGYTHGSFLGLGVKRDGSIAYVAGPRTTVGFVDAPVKRWDFATHAFLSDLAAAIPNTVILKDILVLDDDSVLVPYLNTTTHAQYVIRYSAAGAVVATYPIVPSSVRSYDHLSYGTDDSYFVIWTQSSESSTFSHVRLSDGQELLSVVMPTFAAGIPQQAVADEMAPFGISNSCPLMTVRSAVKIEPPISQPPINQPPTSNPPGTKDPCPPCSDQPGNPGPKPPIPTSTPLPPPELGCAGGGVCPDGNEPTNSEDWSIYDGKTPDVWEEIVTKTYPGGAETVLRHSTKTMVFPTMIEPRVTRGGWSSFDLALSDWRGNSEASEFAAQYEDADARIRTIIADIGTTAYAKVERTLYLLSEQGRKAGLDPRPIHVGYLARSPRPQANRKAQITSVDVAASTFFSLNPAAPLQKARIDPDHLAAGDVAIINTPLDVRGLPYRWVVGEHSDRGLIDVNGEPADVGICPLRDIGDLIVNGTTVVTTTETITVIPPPEIYDFGVVGSGGSATYTYQVSAIFANGETRGSNVVVISGAPVVRTASDYTFIKWRPPAGWEAYYDANCIGIRIGGRDSNPPQTYLDTGRHAVLGDGLPDWTPGGLGTGEYHDDQDNDSPKTPGPPAVGTATTTTTTPGDPTTATDSTAYGVFEQGLSFLDAQYVYGPDLQTDSARNRVLLDPNNPDVVTWRSVAWPFSTPYIEVGPSGNTIRLSVVLFTGALLAAIRSGGVTPAWNGCGVTTTGDETGTPITEAAEGYIVTVNELALKNNGQGYRTGAFFPLEAFRSGTTILNTRLLREWQAQTVEWIGDRGYQIHLFLDGPTTLQQFHQWFNTTFFTFDGQTDAFQIGVWGLPIANIDLTGTRHYRQHIELASTLPDGNPADDEVENAITGHYRYNPDKGDYEASEPFENTDSQLIYGVRPADLECRCTRHEATFFDAMARRLFWNSVAPVYQPFPVGMVGFEQPMGSVFRATHPDGPGSSGYVDRPFMVIRKSININGPNQRVVMMGRDLSRMLESAFAADGLKDENDAEVDVLGDSTSSEPPPVGAGVLM